MNTNDIINYLLDELINWEGNSRDVEKKLIRDGFNFEFMSQFFGTSEEEYQEIKKFLSEEQ